MPDPRAADRYRVQTLAEVSSQLLQTLVERRRTCRFSCGDVVEVTHAGTGISVATATMQNISKGGLAIRLPYAMASGTVIVIRGARLQETATVRHSTPHEESGYIVGCEFARPLLALWF
jgi:hypothetical protein